MEKHDWSHALSKRTGRLIRRSNYVSNENDDVLFVCIAGYDKYGRFDTDRLWKQGNPMPDGGFYIRECPATDRNHQYRKSRQITDLETRGNEAFSALIDGLLQLQDPVRGKERFPNKGKKTLVFSDSRQQAANVATELGEISNLDEARRLLLMMLNQNWYVELDDKRKNLDQMYYWYAFFSLSKGVVPFDDSLVPGERKRFTIHQIDSLCSLLATSCLKLSADYTNIEIDEEKKIVLIDFLNRFSPDVDDLFSIDLEKIIGSAYKFGIEKRLNKKLSDKIDIFYFNYLKRSIRKIKRKFPPYQVKNSSNKNYLN